MRGGSYIRFADELQICTKGLLCVRLRTKLPAWAKTEGLELGESAQPFYNGCFPSLQLLLPETLSLCPAEGGFRLKRSACPLDLQGSIRSERGGSES